MHRGYAFRRLGDNFLHDRIERLEADLSVLEGGENRRNLRH